MLSKQTTKRFNPFGIDVGKIPDTAESKSFWYKYVPRSELKALNKAPMFAIMKAGYRRTLRAATALSLGLMVVGVQVMKTLSLDAREAKSVDLKVEVMDIPVTEQIRRPTPPPRPLVPVPTEDESVPKDATIAFTDLDLSDLPPPPPAPEPTDESSYIFVAYDTPPEPIGGWSSIYKKVVYPEIAVRAGVEGVVYLKVLVNEQGGVDDAQVMKPSGVDVGFEEAALQAARKIKWKPALQREHPVKVWIGFPVQFKLDEEASG